MYSRPALLIGDLLGDVEPARAAGTHLGAGVIEGEIGEARHHSIEGGRARQGGHHLLVHCGGDAAIEQAARRRRRDDGLAPRTDEVGHHDGEAEIEQAEKAQGREGAEEMGHPCAS